MNKIACIDVDHVFYLSLTGFLVGHLKQEKKYTLSIKLIVKM
jgi:hypothetical protein